MEYKTEDFGTEFISLDIAKVSQTLDDTALDEFYDYADYKINRR